MTAPTLAGQLSITLTVAGERVQTVQIASSRPLQAVRLCHGRHPAEALRLLGMLYSVCGSGQRVAGVMACEQALGLPPQAERQRARTLLCQIETLHEHIGQVLLVWPLLFTLPVEPAQALGWPQRALAALDQTALLNPEGAGVTIERVALRDLLARIAATVQTVLGHPAADWLRLTTTPAGFSRWLHRSDTPATRSLRQVHAERQAGMGRCDCPPLPLLPAAELSAWAAEPAHTLYPVWHNAPHETSVYTRQRQQPLLRALHQRHGNGLLSRLLARLLEIAGLTVQLEQTLTTLPDTIPPAPRQTHPRGTGLAQLDVARGRLIHAVSQQDGQISDYRIIAPTEWNCHPQGVLARSLSSLSAPDEPALRRQAERLIHAIDPCVGYTLTVTDTATVTGHA